jgi:hypothetical protein
MKSAQSSLLRGRDDTTRAPEAPITTNVQVFVSFDVEHDEDLYELLLEQSTRSSSGFTVSGSSNRSLARDVWSEKVRRRIRTADQMIVICGEHTESSVLMSSELRIAQEEQIAYVLLWGRREIMCTKPIGARLTEGMYSWTRQILLEQITLALRKTDSDAAAATLRRPPR